jgi:AraC-like DNA-binding protein
MGLLTSHHAFQTNALERGSQFASQAWERNTCDIVEGRYGLRWNQVELHKSMLSYIEHDCAVQLVAEGPLSDHFRVFFQKQGSIRHTLNGQEFVSNSRRAVAHAPGIDLKLDLQPFELLLVSLRGEFVRDALAHRFGRLPPLGTWVGELPSVPYVDTLRSMATWFCGELDRPGSLLAMPGKPRQHAERMLLATFVECLAEMAPRRDGAVLDIGELQIRQAEEWIDEHLTEAIGVEEIACALGVGVRSLQRTFKRVRNCSPMEAVLQRRLERARQALLAATPEETVTNIATEFAFIELGRFARQYKAHFGENPSETLKRRIGPVAY